MRKWVLISYRQVHGQVAQRMSSALEDRGIPSQLVLRQGSLGASRDATRREDSADCCLLVALTTETSDGDLAALRMERPDDRRLPLVPVSVNDPSGSFSSTELQSIVEFVALHVEGVLSGLELMDGAALARQGLFRPSYEEFKRIAETTRAVLERFKHEPLLEDIRQTLAELEPVGLAAWEQFDFSRWRDVNRKLTLVSQIVRLLTDRYFRGDRRAGCFFGLPMMSAAPSETSTPQLVWAEISSRLHSAAQCSEKEAEVALREACGLSQSLKASPRYHLLLGLSHCFLAFRAIEREEFDEADKQLHQASQCKPGCDEIEQGMTHVRNEKALREAFSRFRCKDFEGAVAEVDMVARDFVQSSGVSRLRAVCLNQIAYDAVRRGDMRGAARLLQDARSLEPKDKAIERNLKAVQHILSGQGDTRQEGRQPSVWPRREPAGYLRTLFRRGSPGAPKETLDQVHFSVTSPPVVARGAKFVIDIWAHLEKQRELLLKRAQAQAEGKPVRFRTKGPALISRGTVLTVVLNLEGFIIPNPEDTILWVGSMGNATFLASAPEGVSLGEKQGTASIRVAGLEIARLSFVVEVGSPGSTKTEEVLASSEKRHRKAFVCYASQDKKAVGARLQGMQKTSTELKVWVDSVELRSGQYWAKELVNVIPAQDIFYLFWSSHAKASKWVEMEWRCALSTRGLDFIDPVPLVSPNLVPPPPELASKHFDDWVLLFMRDGGQDTRE